MCLNQPLELVGSSKQAFTHRYTYRSGRIRVAHGSGLFQYISKLWGCPASDVQTRLSLDGSAQQLESHFFAHEFLECIRHREAISFTWSVGYTPSGSRILGCPTSPSLQSPCTLKRSRMTPILAHRPRSPVQQRRSQTEPPTGKYDKQ